jgi:hypothetical protein
MTGNSLSYKRAVNITLSGSQVALNVDAGFPHARGFHVGTAGNLKIITSGGDTVTLYGASGFVPVEAVAIVVSGTTASNIAALY